MGFDHYGFRSLWVSLAPEITVVTGVRRVNGSEGSVTLGPWIPEPSTVEEALQPPCQ